MNKVAQRALQKLLSQAESAWASGVSGKALSLPFTEAKLPAYFDFPTSADRLACNADLGLAEHAQAIAILWDPRSGDRRQIQRITLVDADKLAAFLEVTARWAVIEAAHEALSRFVDEFPVLSQVIAVWKEGAAVRRTSANDVGDWQDACRVIRRRRASGDADLPHRGLSVSLFHDSKRLEELWPMLDILLQGGMDGASRSDEEICGELGIVKFPSTFLLAGRVGLVYDGQALDVRTPYLGVSPTHIDAIEPLGEIDTLLSVENLSTFHELARQALAERRCAVIYTAGMPSPSWLRVYRLLLQALPGHAEVLHWGDIDAGGFRIANRLASACQDGSRVLSPYGMAGELIKAGSEATEGARKTLDQAELRTIRRICSARAWDQEWAFVDERKLAYEQEGMRAVVPEPGSRDVAPA